MHHGNHAAWSSLYARTIAGLIRVSFRRTKAESNAPLKKMPLEHTRGLPRLAVVHPSKKSEIP